MQPFARSSAVILALAPSSASEHAFMEWGFTDGVGKVGASVCVKEPLDYLGLSLASGLEKLLSRVQLVGVLFGGLFLPSGIGLAFPLRLTSTYHGLVMNLLLLSG